MTRPDHDGLADACPAEVANPLPAAKHADPMKLIALGGQLGPGMAGKSRADHAPTRRPRSASHQNREHSFAGDQSQWGHAIDSTLKRHCLQRVVIGRGVFGRGVFGPHRRLARSE